MNMTITQRISSGTATALVLGATVAGVTPPAVAAVELFIADRGEDVILRFDGVSGAFVDTFASSGALDRPVNVEFGPDGHLYVANFGDGYVLRFNGQTGAYMGIFASYSWLEETVEVLFRNGYLYALGNDHHNCVVFDDTSGTFVKEFGDPIMRYPHDMVFGPDGLLYVTTEQTTQGLVQVWDVRDYQLVDWFAPPGAISLATGIAFGPDGHVYVCDWYDAEILRYDGQTHELIDVFVPSGSGGLSGPSSLAFRPDGYLYVSNSNGVHRYDAQTGAFVDVFIADGTGGLDQARGFVFRCPEGDLDCDDDIDVSDHHLLAACLGGPGVTTAPPDCYLPVFEQADLDGDGDVDLGDFLELQQYFTGS